MVSLWFRHQIFFCPSRWLEPKNTCGNDGQEDFTFDRLPLETRDKLTMVVGQMTFRTILPEYDECDHVSHLFNGHLILLAFLMKGCQAYIFHRHRHCMFSHQGKLTLMVEQVTLTTIAPKCDEYCHDVQWTAQFQLEVWFLFPILPYWVNQTLLNHLWSCGTNVPTFLKDGVNGLVQADEKEDAGPIDSWKRWILADWWMKSEVKMYQLTRLNCKSPLIKLIQIFTTRPFSLAHSYPVCPWMKNVKATFSQTVDWVHLVVLSLRWITSWPGLVLCVLFIWTSTCSVFQVMKQ